MGARDDGLAAGGLQNDETRRLTANLWRESLLPPGCTAVVMSLMRLVRTSL